MSAKPEQAPPESHEPLAESSFADTSFLLDLISISSHPAAELQQAKAEARWQELRSASIDKQEVYCYWSPIVFNELVYSAAKAITQHVSLQHAVQAFMQEESPEFRIDEELQQLHADMRFTKRSHIPPWFIAKILPFIEMRIGGLQKHLRPTSDEWHVGPYAIVDLMRWGELDPADCVIAIAAANSPASVLLTHDSHLARAKARLKEFLDLGVIHD